MTTGKPSHLQTLHASEQQRALLTSKRTTQGCASATKIYLQANCSLPIKFDALDMSLLDICYTDSISQCCNYAMSYVIVLTLTLELSRQL